MSRGFASLRWGNFIFKHRNSLFPVVFGSLFLLSRPGIFLTDPLAYSLTRWLGLTLTLAGLSFRMAVIGYAYIKRGGKDGKVYADHLVVRGFFAHVRHPMYVGNLLIALGLTLLYNSVWAYGIAIPFFLFSYLSMALAEETFLRGKFGQDYVDYEKRVNRFIPNFSGIGKTLSEFKYDWKRSLRKDYGTLFGTGLLMLLIEILKDPRIRSFEALLSAIIRNPGTWLLGGIYVAVRLLKKTGKLASSNG